MEPSGNCVQTFSKDLVTFPGSNRGTVTTSCTNPARDCETNVTKGNCPPRSGGGSVCGGGHSQYSGDMTHARVVGVILHKGLSDFTQRLCEALLGSARRRDLGRSQYGGWTPCTEGEGQFVEGGTLSITWQDIVLLKFLRLPCPFDNLKISLG